jgi:hypothetical protein
MDIDEEGNYEKELRERQDRMVEFSRRRKLKLAELNKKRDPSNNIQSSVIIANETELYAIPNDISIETKLMTWGISKLHTINTGLAQGLLDLVLVAGVYTIGKNIGKSEVIGMIANFVRTHMIPNIKTIQNNTTIFYIILTTCSSILFYSGYSLESSRAHVLNLLGDITHAQNLMREDILQLSTTEPLSNKVTLAASMGHLNTCLLYLKKLWCGIKLEPLINVIGRNGHNMSTIISTIATKTNSITRTTIVTLNDFINDVSETADAITAICLSPLIPVIESQDSEVSILTTSSQDSIQSVINIIRDNAERDNAVIGPAIVEQYNMSEPAIVAQAYTLPEAFLLNDILLADESNITRTRSSSISSDDATIMDAAIDGPDAVSRKRHADADGSGDVKRTNSGEKKGGKTHKKHPRKTNKKPRKKNNKKSRKQRRSRKHYTDRKEK